MRITNLRRPEEHPETRAAANRAFAEGERLRRLGTKDALLKSIPHFTESLRLWRELPDIGQEAVTLEYLGWVYRFLGDKQKALEYYSQSAPVMGKAVSHQGSARIYEISGRLCEELGDRQKAIQNYLQAAKFSELSHDLGKVASVLQRLCLVYRSIGETQKAIDAYDEALLFCVTFEYMSKGAKDGALNYFEDTLRYVRSNGDQRTEAAFLEQIGKMCRLMEEHQFELHYYDLAATLWQALGEKERAVETLQHLSISYRLFYNEPNKALDYTRRYYQEALPLMRAAGHHEAEALQLYHLGELYEKLSEWDDALKHFLLALELFRLVDNHEWVNITMRTIASLYFSMGRKDEAYQTYNELLPLTRKLENGPIINISYDLSRLAFLERERGNLTRARKYIEEAINVREEQGAMTIEPTIYETINFSDKDYEFYLDLLIDFKEPEAAFLASERSRARTLLRMLRVAQVDIHKGGDPSLLETEKWCREQLALKERQLAQLLNSRHIEEEIARAEAEIEEALWQLNDAQAALRSRSHTYASQAKSSFVSIEEIQQEGLDADTLLLEFALGEERSFLWTVMGDSIKHYVLPPRTEIERDVRYVHAQLSKHPLLVEGCIYMPDGEPASQPNEYLKAIARLSETLLGPATPLLRNRRLVIVADGALQYLPFSVLPEPSALAEVRGGAKLLPEHLLLSRHEIVYMPSASALVMLRRDMLKRRPAPQACVIIADPVFDKTDERFKSAQLAGRASEKQGQGTFTTEASALEADAEFAGVARESGLMKAGRIMRLEHSGEEAQAIYQMTRGKGGRLVLGFDASRETVVGLDLSDFRIIHFATHGIMDSVHPELSGLVLSLMDEQGKPQSGFLRLYDIYNLNLAADLVVLSACQTALGKEVKGEGLLSLTRGFMYAGAARVIASLWEVEDEATAELMKLFYAKVLGEARMPPAAALREAQLELQRRYPESYYWAGFVLQGEWK
jgi:CHAT domain-containing protein